MKHEKWLARGRSCYVCPQGKRLAPNLTTCNWTVSLTLEPNVYLAKLLLASTLCLASYLHINNSFGLWTCRSIICVMRCQYIELNILPFLNRTSCFLTFSGEILMQWHKEIQDGGVGGANEIRNDAPLFRPGGLRSSLGFRNVRNQFMNFRELEKETL